MNSFSENTSRKLISLNEDITGIVDLIKSLKKNIESTENQNLVVDRMNEASRQSFIEQKTAVEQISAANKDIITSLEKIFLEINRYIEPFSQRVGEIKQEADSLQNIASSNQQNIAALNKGLEEAAE